MNNPNLKVQKYNKNELSPLKPKNIILDLLNNENKKLEQHRKNIKQ